MKLVFFSTGFVMLAFVLGTSDRAVAQGTYRGGLVTPPLPKPGFTLTDTSGATFDFRLKTEGYITLLFFGYANCPDVCPLHMANIAVALKKFPSGFADQVKLVFVTTDPARDSAKTLRSWLDHFDKRFIGLTGTEAAIGHSSFVLAYTKDNLAHL